MPISRFYSQDEAAKLGFDAEEPSDESFKRVRATDWLYPEEFELLERAFGNRLQYKINKQFELMMEDLLLDAEKEVDSRNEPFWEEA
jgi:hypothetical protein